MSGSYKWWQGDQAHKNLAELADWLMGELSYSTSGIVHMLAKPWHYDAEYQEMRAAQQATREDWGTTRSEP